MDTMAATIMAITMTFTAGMEITTVIGTTMATGITATGIMAGIIIAGMAMAYMSTPQKQAPI
jgi:hypothetical protein